jgi:hypothetical protein
VEKKQKISISSNKSDSNPFTKGKDKKSVESKAIEAAIEDSLIKTQKFLDEDLLKQEDSYNNMIDEIQLTK